MNGRRLALVAVVATAVMAGCAGKIAFDNVTPGTPQRIEGKLYKPDGRGPFPALVLLHGCQGVVRQTQTWAHWLRERGYVALVTDSFGPRNDPADCKGGDDSGPSTARFDDAIGALRYLQAQPFVIPDRVASFGWSQGGLFAMSVINGPTLERARARGVTLPRAGYAAAIAMYPGGCEAYVKELFDRGEKIMGFGHRVYRTVDDPRATILRALSKQLGEQSGEPIWYEISEQVDEIVRRDKALRPNVDFYAGSLLHYVGLPTDLFTPMFAASRAAGWTAHIREQYADNRLIRPESEYIGPRDQKWVPVEEREAGENGEVSS